MDMKKNVATILGLLIIFIFITGCPGIGADRNHSPVFQPNTRWVSEELDMFFEVRDYGRIPYAQIIIDGELIELSVEFDTGRAIFFTELAPRDPETGAPVFVRDIRRSIGRCRFSPYTLRVYDIEPIRNREGFFDDSITEITFIRENIGTFFIPNSRWVSEEQNMFFEINEIGVVSYAQIIVDGEIIEFYLTFNTFSSYVSTIFFSDIEARLPEGGGRSWPDDLKRSTGQSRFDFDELVVSDIKNMPGREGFFDESITEIVFIREDIETSE